MRGNIDKGAMACRGPRLSYYIDWSNLCVRTIYLKYVQGDPSATSSRCMYSGVSQKEPEKNETEVAVTE